MSDSNLRSVITDQVDDEKHVTNQTEAEPQESPKETPPQEEQPKETIEEFSQRAEHRGRTPEELDEIYGNYQKAYTQRRQKEKEEIRKYQEQIKAYEEKLKGQITPQAPSTQMNQDQKEVQRQFDLGNLSFEQYTQAMQRFAIENAERIAEEKFEKLYTQREDLSNQEQMLKRFNSLDERFDQKFTNPDSPEYNKLNHWLYQSVASELANALQAHIDTNGSSKGFDSDTIAKEAIKRFDEQIDSVVKTRVKESTQQAQAKAVNVARSNPKGVSVQSQTLGSKNLRSIIGSSMGD